MTLTKIARSMVRAQSTLQMLSAAEWRMRQQGVYGPKEAAGVAEYREMDGYRLKQGAQRLRRFAAANDCAMEAVPA